MYEMTMILTMILTCKIFDDFKLSAICRSRAVSSASSMDLPVISFDRNPSHLTSQAAEMREHVYPYKSTIIKTKISRTKPHHWKNSKDVGSTPS